MDTSEAQLSEKQRAYVRLLASHMDHFRALLHDIAGPVPDGTANAVTLSRELALSNTHMELAFMYAREHIFKRAANGDGG